MSGQDGECTSVVTRFAGKSGSRTPERMKQIGGQRGGDVTT